MRDRALLLRRAALALGVVVSLAVPVLTLPRLPEVSPWPALAALPAWVIGKYVLCPLRWHALTDAGLGRWWHLRAYAESELLGLLTPGHVGADLWRMHRLRRSGLGGGDAVASVGLDRFVGAVGLVVFMVFAGTALPLRQLLIALGVGMAMVVAVLVLRRVRPSLLPTRPLPPPRRFLFGLAMSVAYQLSIAALLFGTVAATGHTLSLLELIGAFGATQLAGAAPGPHGASPRDGALVLALVALGLPLIAAAAAVALKATFAWLPAIALGGSRLLLTRRESRLAAAAA